MKFSQLNVVKILSNYLGKIWNLLSVFIFVPVYIYFLGIESYAIIGFYALILGLISFADAGMSSAITREISLDSEPAYKLNIVKKIECIYWAVLFFIAVLIIVGSRFIAEKWLVSEQIPLQDLQNYVILIGVGTCIQMVCSLYFGAMFGLGQQVQANTYQIIWTTLKSLFVVALFILIQANLYVFLFWQIICNIIYVLLLRYAVFKDLRKKIQPAKLIENFVIPSRIFKYIGGMTLVAIISAINSQADKLIISYYYTLKTFGYYTMVSTLAQIPVFLTIPMASFVFPLLSKYSENNQQILFNDTVNKFVHLLYLIVIPVAIIACFYPIELLQAWIRSGLDVATLSDFNFLICTLMIGSLLLAMQFPFYYTLLANTQTKYTVYQGIVQISLGIPLLLYFAQSWGLKYVGIPWLLINLFALIYLSYICFRLYLNINLLKFILHDVLPPVIMSIILGTIGHVAYIYTELSFYLFFVLSIVATICAVIAWGNYISQRKSLAFKHLYDFPRG